MRPWLGIAVLAAAALPSAAAAQSAFDQRIAHWRISAGGASCIAFNRPAYREQHGESRVFVAFWANQNIIDRRALLKRRTAAAPVARP